MKLRSSPILGLALFSLILADTNIDCKDVAVSGLMDAMWFGASLALSQATGEDQSGQGQPGAPGADGINCWDLNGNGEDDPEEDANGDGEWNALDCQGPAGEDGAQGSQGQPGPPGQNGADGQDGRDGRDGADGQDGLSGINCWDLDGDRVNDPAEDVNGDGLWDAQDCQGAAGEDGEDLTGVIARGVIPGADIPEPGEPDWVPAAGTAVGIERVFRPENPFGPTTRGRYRVIVNLPQRAQPYVEDEIVILVSIEALHTDGGPPGSGGPTAQAFGFWEIIEVDNGAGTVEIEVMIRTAPLNFFTDATFSLVVLVP